MKSKKWIVIAEILSLVPFFGISQPAERACFSVPGGFYEESFQLEVFPFYPQHHIRFTTNGNRPTAQSRLYTEPLLLDESLYSTSDIYTIPVAIENEMFLVDSVKHCIVIRAAVFDENDSCISEVATNSYFIRALGCDTHGLPVVSLCSDSLDLFDYYHGIMVPGVYFNSNFPEWSGNYFCRGPFWERVCNVEFYELDNEGINQQAGLRTHGGASRRLQQKGFKLFAREEYGQKRFSHRFFSQTTLERFKRLSLKPFRCSNWRTTGLQDALAQEIARPLNLETLCLRQAVLFLNGEYWGIYALEESPDEHYLEDHLGVDPERCNIMKKWKELDCGDSTHWHDLCQWMWDADLSLAENYEFAAAHIDIDNFIDYQVFELYSTNVDWPANNVRCWQEGDGPWRWIFYDGDGCFFRNWDAFANAIDTSHAVFPSNARATLFFRKLLENQSFFDAFFTRFNQLKSDWLRYDSIAPRFQSLCDLIEEEVPSQAERFGFPANMEKWITDVNQVDSFLSILDGLMDWNLEQFGIVIDLAENHVFSEITCFPNPAHGGVFVNLDVEVDGVTAIQVFDVLGRKVYDQSIRLTSGSNSFAIDLPPASGLYFLKIDDYVTKIVRQ